MASSRLKLGSARQAARSRGRTHDFVHELPIRRMLRAASSESLEMIRRGAIGEIRVTREAHSQGVNREQQSRVPQRIPNRPPMSAREWAGLGDDRHALAAALNRNDTAEQLAGVHGWIFFGDRIPARG